MIASAQPRRLWSREGVSIWFALVMLCKTHFNADKDTPTPSVPLFRHLSCPGVVRRECSRVAPPDGRVLQLSVSSMSTVRRTPAQPETTCPSILTDRVLGSP